MVLAAVPAAFLVAWAVLLLLWATEYLWIKPISQLLGNLPIVGGAVAGAVASGFGALISWVASILDHTIVPAVESIAAPIGAIWATFGQLVANAEQVAATLPATAAALWREAIGAANDASSALGRIAGLVASVAGIASGLAVARALIETIQSRTIPAARDQAISAAAQHAAALTAAEAATRSSADALASAAISAEARTRAAEVGAIDGWRTGIVDPAIRGIESELSGVASAVGVLTAAQLIARTTALEQTLTRTIDECVTPTCEAVTPQLPWLSALADGSILLGLGALVGEAIADPQGAARATVGLVDGLEGAAADLFGLVTGRPVPGA